MAMHFLTFPLPSFSTSLSTYHTLLLFYKSQHIPYLVAVLQVSAHTIPCCCSTSLSTYHTLLLFYKSQHIPYLVAVLQVSAHTIPCCCSTSLSTYHTLLLFYKSKHISYLVALIAVSDSAPWWRIRFCHHEHCGMGELPKPNSREEHRRQH